MNHRAIAIMAGLLMTFAGAALPQERIQVVPLASPQQRVLVPATLGVIVNVDDPRSVALGEQYAEIRSIPKDNIIRLRLPKANHVLASLFQKQLDTMRQSGALLKFQGFALAFDRPYRIGRNQSITSGFAIGIDNRRFSGNCNETAINPDAAAAPGSVLISRPAMLLSVDQNSQADRALFERGRDADGTDPGGDVLLVKTPDPARSPPREESMDMAKATFASEITVDIRSQPEGLKDTAGIIGYQTGLPVVAGLGTNTYRPGAYADSLTSYGGALDDSKKQTTVAAFLRAGLTAAYGTVREPCNIREKFPDPFIMLRNYLAGDTVVEAYWKSVGMVTEGLFVGEPLARPFAPFEATIDSGRLQLSVNRHSALYLQDPEQAKAHNLSVYMVQSGLPQPVGTADLKPPFKPGDLIAEFQLDADAPAKPIIGVIAN